TISKSCGRCIVQFGHTPKPIKSCKINPRRRVWIRSSLIFWLIKGWSFFRSSISLLPGAGLNEAFDTFYADARSPHSLNGALERGAKIVGRHLLDLPSIQEPSYSWPFADDGALWTCRGRSRACRAVVIGHCPNANTERCGGAYGNADQRPIRSAVWLA